MANPITRKKIIHLGNSFLKSNYLLNERTNDHYTLMIASRHFKLHFKSKKCFNWSLSEIFQYQRVHCCKRHASSVKNGHYDVCIVGGGAVGSTLAHLLSTHLPSLKVALLDAKTPRSVHDVLNVCSETDAVDRPCIYPSPRAYALSPRSLSLLGRRVLDQFEESGRIAYYNSMQIWESDGPAILKFDHRDVEKGQIMNNRDWFLNCDENKDGRLQDDILGAVVEDEIIVSCLWEQMKQKGEVDLISPVSIKNINAPENNDDGNHASKVSVSYETRSSTSSQLQQTLSANLLVAADGSNSYVRRALGTFPTVSYAYGRQAVTCTVEVEESLKKTAFQRFQPNGPIALLPIWEDDAIKRQGNCGSKKYANIVWSTTPQEAKQLMELPPEVFVQKMNDLLQTGPVNVPPLLSKEIDSFIPGPLKDAIHGLEMLSRSMNNGLTMSGMTERGLGFHVPPMIKEVVGRRFAFDLTLMHAKNYTVPRVALVGDAAHTIHPMAGQGLNLGMGDVESLVYHLKKAVESGMGIEGNAGLEYALQQYESSRQRQVVATMGGIQFLHGAFATTFSPFVHARSMGMNVINSAGPLRRKLVQVATTGLEGI